MQGGKVGDCLCVLGGAIKAAQRISDFTDPVVINPLDDHIARAFAAHGAGHTAGVDGGLCGTGFNRLCQHVAVGLIRATGVPIAALAAIAYGDPSCHKSPFGVSLEEFKLKSNLFLSFEIGIGPLTKVLSIRYFRGIESLRLERSGPRFGLLEFDRTLGPGVVMQVLIVESNPDLGAIWQRYLERQGMSVTSALGQASAVAYLQDTAADLIILDLVLEDGSAFAVADYANYRYPETPVIFVTNSTFFSDGSIFQHMANARAFVTSEVDPADLTAMVEHYGRVE